ncbi:hypothetical protein AVEN_97583-1 [Araneus ventricosus]|uniref:Uncharacterized protein n=1 Tax=Araneus ventricosus TaxID=182803 RepID=A0A4Y2F782_ARAVE|nr:hypothetical protein AVEN_97583-1 [Araneus ventricosus]
MEEDEFNVQMNQLKKNLKSVQEEGEITCFNVLSVLGKLKNTVQLLIWNFFWSIIRQMWYDFIEKEMPHISNESTYYPDSTTNTVTSETETTDSEAYELFDQLKEIYNDLAVLSQKLDEIAYLQNFYKTETSHAMSDGHPNEDFLRCVVDDDPRRSEELYRIHEPVHPKDIQSQ